MKKLLFMLALAVSGIAFAQYYPNNGYQYPNNNGYYGNDGYYGDDYYFPEDYYYDYPNDYYAESYYRSYYEDYRRSIYNVDWNRFFRMHRLSRYQIQQIIWLNDLYPTYRSWLYQYQYNPDRWYYDRFYALERILGRRVYANYYQHYYRHHPIVYFQIHRQNYYIPKYRISSRYKNRDVRVFREDAFRSNAFRKQYESDMNNVNPNPRVTESGFRSGATGKNNGISPNNGDFRNTQNQPSEQVPTDGGFRNQGNSGTNNNGVRNTGGFRNTQNTGNEDGVRNGGYRNQQNTSENAEFRNNGGFRTQENNDRREVQRNAETSERRSQPEERNTSNRESSSGGESRNSGFRSGTR